MDYLDIINRIIETERKASQITREARESYDKTISGMDEEIAKMAEDYRLRAERRIADVQLQEQAFTEAQLAKLDRQREETLQQMWADFDKNKQKYIAQRFARALRQHDEAQ